jgi:hypothetical protein
MQPARKQMKRRTMIAAGLLTAVRALAVAGMVGTIEMSAA